MTSKQTGFRVAVGGALVMLMTMGWAVNSADAQDRKGQVTQLPIPRFVSMKAVEGNVRRGPSLSHRIDWVYKRKDLPLQITNEFGHWRQVRDHDGAGGWVHYSLLSGARTALIEADQVNVLSRPDPNANVVAIVEKGVVARLSECAPDWCRIRIEGYKGWVRKAALWGVAPEEIWQ